MLIFGGVPPGIANHSINYKYSTTGYKLGSKEDKLGVYKMELAREQIKIHDPAIESHPDIKYEAQKNIEALHHLIDSLEG